MEDLIELKEEGVMVNVNGQDVVKVRAELTVGTMDLQADDPT